MREDRTAFEPETSKRLGPPAPPPDLAVREAIGDDVADCVALAGLVADGTSDEWAALFRRDIGRSDRYLAVARTGSELVGYGRTAWFEPDAEAPVNAAPAGYYLIGLVVDPSWRRRGVAIAITHARLDWVGQRASEAWYFADRNNAVSIRLHERSRFATVTTDFWFPTGVTPQPPGDVMSRRTVAALAMAGVMLAGCGTGAQPGEQPDSLAGLCADHNTEVAEDEPGLDTAEEAIDAFVADGDDFLADATFEGQQILYEGEVVGRLSVSSMPAGGYLVTSAEWCYPDDF